MANWNSGAYFNRKGNEGGFTWNSKYYLFVVRINDTFNAKENVPEMLAKLILTDKAFKLTDVLTNTALYDNLKEEFRAKDEKPFVTLLVSIMEDMGMKDEFSAFLVSLYLNENQKVLDEVKLLVELLEAEIVDASDFVDLQAFYDILDRYNLDDLKMSYSTFLYLHDLFGLIDRDPKEAVSDWLIGNADTTDKAYDYLIPFGGMRIDWANTSIAHLPKAELTEITMPSVDGSIIADTTYRDRVFSIVAFSEDGMTVAEKEDLKRRIASVLDSSKHSSKKLTVQSRGVSFDARYEGEASIKDGPSFLRLDVDLRVGPYGYDLFPTELRGSGLINNAEGAAPLRVKHTITGPVTNPSFTINGTTYTWRGTVSSGSSLIIDHDNYTCYTIDSLGNKRNVLQFLTGEFTSIPAGSSAVLVAASNTESRIVTEYSPPLLW